MVTILEKNRSWLMPIFLILFIAEVLTLPLVLDITYAGRSDAPDHVLTYTKNKLTWNTATDIDKRGVAKLSFFDTVYENIESENGDKIIAPGTEATRVIRLKNDIEGTISYTAVLYEIKRNEQIPVETSMLDRDFKDTDDYNLPKGVKKEHVIRAVTGNVKGGQIQDFDIHWIWDFYNNEQQDQTDTDFGNEAEDDITIGFYLLVEDNNEIVKPSAPKTGDNSMVGGYFALMGMSAIMIILLLVSKRRENE